MKSETPELLFESRAAFRAWLAENGQTSGNVWLVFGKTKALVTLTANEALEEALCFGWIDGQMQRADETKYRKYFARRRPKSVWSEKNKALISALRAKGMMTEWGEQAVAAAIKNGMWDAPKAEPVTEEQVADFAAKLVGISPACENFNNMPRSVQTTYTRRYLSFKTEAARQRDFERIIERLGQNLKPM